MPSCGSWDFESITAEGWALSTSETNASNGAITASNAVPAALGSYSLALPMRTDGASRFSVVIKRSICAGGQALDLQARTLRIRVRRVGPVGDGYFELFNGSTFLFGGGDFETPANADYWAEYTLPLSGTFPAITHIALVFRTFTPWTGTVYVDDIRIN